MKKFLSFIFTLIISLFGITSVNAVDDSVIFHDEIFSGVTTIPGAGSTYKEVTTSEGNKVAFCFNMKNDAPPQGAKLVKADNGILPNAEKTNQIIYILDNGLGGNWNTSIITGSYTKHQKYYITQLAVWMAQGSLDPTTVKNSGTLGKAAYKLYNAATKNATVTAYEPKVSLSGDSTMTLKGSDYVSGTITLTVKGADNATVTLVNAPAGSKILVNGVDKGNQAKLTNGTKFQFSVPSSKVSKDLTVKVNAKATATRKRIQIYKYSSDSKYQNIGLIFKEKYTASDELKATIAPKGKLEVVKVELVNGKEVNLSGATLAVKDSKGKVVAQWNTKDENPKKFDDLTIGETYTIYEVKAPKGYVLADSQTVTIKGSTTQIVKVTNTKTTPVKISKQDATTGKELPGAKLVLKDANGKVVDEWVSTTTPHYIENLAAGTYTLSETMAPEGYALTTETVTFTVDATGKTNKEVVMYNKPTKGVTISKQDVATNKELPGATLVLKDSKGNIIDKWVSTTTPHYIPNLPEGTYTLIETQQPKGYELSDEVITFEVKYDGKENVKVVMYNSKNPETSDMNLTLIIVGIVGSLALGTFGFIKYKRA